jgi:hypothetical protein
MKNSIENKYNPIGQRRQLVSITLNGTLIPFGTGARIYFDHIPNIETGQVTGLFACAATPNNLLQDNISVNVTFPAFLRAQSAATNIEGLYVTLVNKKGDTLISQIPFSLLYPFNGRILPINAVDLDSRKCFFTFSGGVPVADRSAAQLVFVMNYQETL